MNLSSFARVFALGGLVFATVSLQATLQGTDQLPNLPKVPSSNTDWLIDGTPFKAGLYKGATDNQLVLDNGLVRRVFQITPEVATIALDNLASGENHVRSIKPEALLTLDGTDYTVGGLTGQPVHNYLRREWLPDLKTIPGTFRCTGWKVGKIEPRFGWKRRPEWMSQELPWPPPGIHLSFDYQADEDTAALGKGSNYSILWKEDFTSNNSASWKIHASPSHPRNSFVNEGKFGEIMADANSAVYAERELPKDAVGATALIDPGTDAGASYGPGLALAWPGLSAKLHLRPEQKQIGVSINGTEVQAISAKVEPTYLRIAKGGQGLVFETSPNGADWKRVYEYTGKISGSAPALLRVGKLSKAADGTDHRDRGAVERCFVREVSALGKVQSASGQNPLHGLTITVHYELHDGLPLLGKWLTVRNGTQSPITVDKFTSEILGVTEVESAVEDKHAQPWVMPQILPVTDYAFGSMTGSDATRQTIHWESDPDYKTQVNYMRRTPALLRISPEVGPRQTIAPGETFESFRAWLLLLDSRDRERAGLAERRMYRTLAPWVAENPVMMHVRRADDAAVRLAIDQCAEVGFEMVILTFGSGFNFENRDAAYQDRFKKLADYAHSKKIALGGYSLLSSRSANPGSDNCVTPKATHGVMPCLGAKWGRDYLAQLKNFTERAGLDILEHDGSYPGDTCASTNHPHHHGYDDSQWVQWRTITDYYRWCRANGVYLNIPDWYYLNGGSKCGMGYREANWSLPRAEQEIVERQNIYDGTWTKAPSMGWMFVPLTEYQGGGAAATIEPLKDHLPHYETRLANLFGAGVQACYRGPRLYDTDETKSVVKKWVDFYKDNRAILDSDLIHLRRADGRDWDGWLHVNPQLKTCGLAMLYNPLETEVTRTIKLPLYYTGLTDTANIRIEENSPTKIYKLSRDYSVEISVSIPARGRVPVFVSK